MSVMPTKKQLSAPRRLLIEKLQAINYGRIEGLVVHQGDPILDPMPRVVREIKFQAENGPRPETVKPDFVLKRQVVELFEYFDSLGHGVIKSIEVQRGLPFRMTVEEVPA